MFTGIIKFTGKVKKVLSLSQGKRFVIGCEKEFLKRLTKGVSSVSINGSCHTVEEIMENEFVVYSSFETLKRTTFGRLSAGEVVNLELSLTLQDFLDGHIVLGHVDGKGEILDIQKRGEGFLFGFRVPDEIASFLVEKDSIAIDGISLTIFDVKGNRFNVAIIPETISKTNLNYKKRGDEVNIEINIFAKYAKKFIYEGKKGRLKLF